MYGNNINKEILYNVFFFIEMLYNVYFLLTISLNVMND